MNLSTPQSLMRGGRATKFGIFLIVIVVIIVYFLLRHPQYTPAMQGRNLAEQMGCFACHGPGGTGGVANPGSQDAQVPSWNGGTSMMFIEKESEIGEWILDGLPQRIRMRIKEKESSDSASAGIQQDKIPGVQKPLLKMPAFRKLLSDKGLQDLVAYFKAVAVYVAPSSEQAKQGYAVASKLGCFGCHGPGGQIGNANPGSFKGYIPPWQGKDFAELSKNKEELRGWILEGKINRFESNALARFFTDRQIIQMKAYKNILKEGELEQLVSYIEWLNSNTINK